mgnify:CR=1 FL=1
MVCVVLQETMQAEKEAYDELQEQKKQSRTALLKSKKQEGNKLNTTWKRNKRMGRTRKKGVTGTENKGKVVN